MAQYKHWVFGAANDMPENQDAIANACKAVKHLEAFWVMNATCTGVYEGPKFTIYPDDGGNTEILAESDDLTTLIDGCMAFAREVERLKSL
jgi:hypothetical protein